MSVYDKFLILMVEESERVKVSFPPLNSAHEAYAVLLEELEEFWEEVRKKRLERNREAMSKELVQLAAMCCRTYYDLEFHDEQQKEVR